MWRASLSGSSPGCLAVFTTVVLPDMFCATADLSSIPLLQGLPVLLQSGLRSLSLQTRLKEQWEACQRGMLEKSAVAEHAWKDHHSIRWEVATVA